MQRLKNPRLNQYYLKNNGTALVKARAQDIAIYTINSTVASAAALVAEADAAAQARNGTLHADYSIPKKYLQYTNYSPPSTSHLGKRTGTSFWMEDITHSGNFPFGSDNANYAVFRNVKDPKYGAVGDGLTDDTAAIMRAMNDGNRCGKDCGSSTVKGAIVYFPPGTYCIL